jgi:hypothetical protein
MVEPGSSFSFRTSNFPHSDQKFSGFSSDPAAHLQGVPHVGMLCGSNERAIAPRCGHPRFQPEPTLCGVRDHRDHGDCR